MKDTILKVLILLIISHISVTDTSAENITIEDLNAKYGFGRNVVNCMYQDSVGFLWFGMANGLYKFDNTSVKYVEPYDNQSFNHPDVRTIIEYLPGKLLLGTYDYGLLTYNTILEVFDTLDIKSKYDLSNIKVNKLFYEEYGVIWVGTNSGLFKISHVNNSDNTFEITQHYSTFTSQLISNEIIDIKRSNDGELWFLTAGEIGKINTQTNTILARMTSESNKSFLFLDKSRILISTYGSGLIIFNASKFDFELDWDFNEEEDVQARYVYKDLNNNIWISISNVGLFLLNEDLDFANAKLISNSNENFNTLNSNVIFYIGESRDGGLFICTDAGINKIIQKDEIFSNCSTQFNKTQASYGIRSIIPIGDSEVLVGTMGMGLKLFNYVNRSIKNIVIDKYDRDFARNIQTIIKDHVGNIWLGTEGMGVVKIKAGTNLSNIDYYENYRAFPSPVPEKSLLNDYIMSMLEDDSGNLWIGTWYGLSLLESSQRLKSDYTNAEIINFLYDPSDVNSLSSNTITCFLQQNNGEIWVGTHNGLNKVIKNGQSYIFDNNISDEFGNSLNSKSIVSIHQSKEGKIWFSTTDGGICRLDPEAKLFYEYNSKNGFIDLVVNAIQEDNQGSFWFGTGDGICRFDPSTFSYNLYTKQDGLVTNLYLLNSSSNSGNTIFFGGDKSLTYFTPENIGKKFYDLNLVLTDIKVFNKSLTVSEKGSSLKKNISYSNSVDLKFNQNFLTFEFASLNFKNQKDVQYSCILEGLETNWNNIGHEQKITYTNLSHGSYVFKVMAYDSGDHDIFEELLFEVIIHPPYWKTKVAYIFYLLIFILSLYKIYTFFLNQEKKKSALALERLNAKRKHEIDIMKLRFFMNISHEFRTPLTLLSAPLEALMKGEASKEKTESYYNLMFQNVQRLKRLIDDLLELRKIDAGYLKLEWKLGNIVEFTQRIYDTFKTYADKREINLRFSAEVDNLMTYFDSDKLDKVLFNLISNAFKYTENGGKIEISIILNKELGSKDGTEDSYMISVKDTGVGIPKVAIDQIFQRFQNTHKSKPIESASTGIGLSLAKELIELHNGNIEVESVEDQGSVFTIKLPMYKSNPVEDKPNESNSPIADTEDIHLDDEGSDSKNNDKRKAKPIILLVEDNEDLRRFLTCELVQQYEILECSNGEEGIELATKNIPDLIVSDIMMDKMDGITMCKKIKSDEKTSHIPVILLTARQADNVKLDGYQTGADGYITKPFSIDILKSRIENLIQQRRKLGAKFSLGIDNVQNPETSNSLDSKFITKLNKLIDIHIDDTELNPTYIASEMAMSRMQLYRKVNALTGQTVNNYLRTIRLNKAANLLLTTDYQIAEIAYMVGFSEPSNFTKSFNKYFNQTPSQFIVANKK